MERCSANFQYHPRGDQRPADQPLTSVVAVEVAPDLKTCKAYISVLGDEESRQKHLQG